MERRHRKSNLEQARFRKFRLKFAVAVALALILIESATATTTTTSRTTRTEENVDVIKQEVEDKLADFDRVVQGNAFKAFKHPKTAVVFNVDLPSNLSSGVTAQAVRLRTGSLRRRGYTLNEFTIPVGAGPRVPLRVVLVYRRFTARVYAVPADYRLVSPVVGIKVYDAANLSAAAAVPELDFETAAGGGNGTVAVPLGSRAAPDGVLCGAFDPRGGLTLYNLSTSPNVCSWSKLGDFALLAPTNSSALGPAPAPAPAMSFMPGIPQRKKKKSSKWKIILGAVLGGIAALFLLLLLLFCIWKCLRRSKVSKMEQRSDRGEMLQTSLIGGSRAPTAGVSRTKPVLESDYAAA